MFKAANLALAAVLSVGIASTAFAQAQYRADMNGVVMANVPASDLCRLNGNPNLLPAGQQLVANEIATRPVACGTPALGATNFAVIGALAGVALLGALASGGNNGATPNT